jgi:hypothetical protein
MAYLKVSPFPSYLVTTDDNGDEEKGGKRGTSKGFKPWVDIRCKES